MADFFRLIRAANLLIVVVTQVLLQYLVLVPALREAGLSPILPTAPFLLLVLCTMLIAAGGYVVNDILDIEADILNKPSRVYVGKAFSVGTAWWLYGFLTLLGFAIACYLAVYVNDLRLVALYPAAVLLLFLYSRYWKNMPLAGNVVVAAFCASVAGVVLFADRANLARMGGQGYETKLLFGGYLLFAFLSTLLREIVKDAEDMDGDQRQGLQTLPIRYGVPAAKRWALGTGAVLLLALMGFTVWKLESGRAGAAAAAVALTIAPLTHTLLVVRKALHKPDFAKASLWAKITMLGGLLLLIVCKLA